MFSKKKSGTGGEYRHQLEKERDSKRRQFATGTDPALRVGRTEPRAT
jgi:hypothetical protein